MNTQKIIIEAPKEGLKTSKGIIAINPNKKEFGSIMVSSMTVTLGQGSNFIDTRRRVAFLTGRLSDLEAIVDQYNLKAGDDYSQKIAPHKIIVKESTIPFYSGQEPKKNPTNNQILVTEDGEPIYRNSYVVPAGSDQHDSLLEHASESQNISENVPAEFAGNKNSK